MDGTVTKPADTKFWQRARRHMLNYGGFVPFVSARAEGAFLYIDRPGRLWRPYLAIPPLQNARIRGYSAFVTAE